MSEQLYQVREFAERSGVTVRTLHHYDQIGLLRPTVHTEAGYRLYSNRDFARLQQIVTLKFIGLSLKQIREILDGASLDLAAMLRLQRITLEKKRSHLELAIQAIGKAERIASSEEEPDWESFKQIIEVITMESNQDFFKKHYTEEQLAELQKRQETEGDWIHQTQEEWKEVISEAESLMGEDPGSERVQKLAERWAELVSRFTLGNPQTEQSLQKLYADRQNWPSTFQAPFSPELQEFMGRARAIMEQRKGKA